MNLQEEINKKVEEVIAAKMDGIITENVEKSISYIIKDMFDNWGKMTKQLKEQIEGSLQINLDKAKLETYNERIASIVKSELDKFIEEKAASNIAELIKNKSSHYQKTEWKMSEIVAVFVEQEFDEDEESFEPTIVVEKSTWGSTHVSFDKEGDRERSNCEFSFSFDTKTGKVYTYDIRGSFGIKSRVREGSIHGMFDDLVFALYANGCTVEMDSYETEFYKDRY